MASDVQLAFDEQSTFFRRKLALPSEAWDSIVRDEHDHGFIVAGAQKAALVGDFKAAMQQAIDEGKSLGWFRNEFESIVTKHGWTGWKGEGSAAGRAWRTRVIYQTNLATSHSAGRWEQMTLPEVMQNRPFWRYVHLDNPNPRLDHKSWNGLELPAGDPWFKIHWPQQAFGCHCYVESISRRELKPGGPDKAPEDGTYSYTVPRTGQVVQLPVGVQYGWNYAPGKSAADNALAARIQQLETTDNAIARLSVDKLRGSEVLQRFFSGKIQGEFPLAVLRTADQAAISAESPVVLLSQESLAAHVKAHPEIGLADYLQVQRILDEGEVYRQGEERLVYLAIGKATYRAALKRTKDGAKNYFLTLFKNETGARPKPDTRLR